jgi:hypothetical protein
MHCNPSDVRNNPKAHFQVKPSKPQNYMAAFFFAVHYQGCLFKQRLVERENWYTFKLFSFLGNETEGGTDALKVGGSLSLARR